MASKILGHGSLVLRHSCASLNLQFFRQVVYDTVGVNSLNPFIFLLKKKKREKKWEEAPTNINNTYIYIIAV